MTESKLLLQCIDCGKEFDPDSDEHKDIPSSNYCKDCFNLRYKNDDGSN